MLVDLIVNRIIQISKETSELVKIKRSIELSNAGIFKVLEIYESIFVYKYKQTKTTISKIELYRERILELIHIRGMNIEMVEIINRKLINTWYKLNKYQQKWKKEHEL